MTNNRSMPAGARKGFLSTLFAKRTLTPNELVQRNETLERKVECKSVITALQQVAGNLLIGFSLLYHIGKFSFAVG